MPTPSPMSVATVGPLEGIVSTCETRPIAIRPETNAATAIIRGRSMANSEPKAMKSTTAAATIPTAALMPTDGRRAFSTADPPSSIWRPGARAASAMWTTRVTSGMERSAALGVEHHRRVGDRAGPADLGGAAGGVRTDHRGHLRVGGDLVQHGRDPGARCRGPRCCQTSPARRSSPDPRRAQGRPWSTSSARWSNRYRAASGCSSRPSPRPGRRPPT